MKRKILRFVTNALAYQFKIIKKNLLDWVTDERKMMIEIDLFLRNILLKKLIIESYP